MKKPKSPAPLKFFVPLWNFALKVQVGIQKELRNSLCRPEGPPSLFTSPFTLELGSCSPQFSKSAIFCLASLFICYGLKCAIRQELGDCRFHSIKLGDGRVYFIESSEIVEFILLVCDSISQRLLPLALCSPTFENSIYLPPLPPPHFPSCLLQWMNRSVDIYSCTLSFKDFFSFK